jgi:hypothetical protein
MGNRKQVRSTEKDNRRIQSMKETRAKSDVENRKCVTEGRRKEELAEKKGDDCESDEYKERGEWGDRKKVRGMGR